MSTIVFRYGIAAPHEGADRVLDQMRLAHAYGRALCWIERGRRWATRKVQNEASAELRERQAHVEGTDAACAWLAAEIRALRKKARARVETAEMRLHLAFARGKLKVAREALYAERARYAAQCPDCRKAKSEEVPCAHATAEAVAMRTKLDAIDLTANELLKNARGHCGLASGTYLLVEAAARSSHAAPLHEKDGITPHDPDMPPPRWDGSGSVAVQIQSTRPLTVKDAVGCRDSRLRVAEPPWAEAWLHEQTLSARAPRREDSIVGSGRGRRPPGTRPGAKGEPDTVAPATKPDGSPARWVRDRACRHGQLQLRIGSDEHRDPIWASWRLDMSRPLPPEASVTWATVHRRMRGPHAEWSLCVTLDLGPHAGPAPRDRPMVAIDVGWRQIDDALRVAAWHDSLGRSGELRLSAADVRALTLHEEIRSQRDAAFDLCKAALKRWITTATAVPDWMQQNATAMHAWRNPGRMVALLRRWGDERPNRGPVETIVFEAVSAWASGDRSRWAEQEHRRLWGLRRRRDIYRVFSAKLAREYSVIVLERFDLRKVVERAPTGLDKAENEQAHRNRQLVAVSDLRNTLCNAVRSTASLVASVDATNSTRACPSCGVCADRNAADSVRLRCDDCSHEWDQDMSGAAPFLLARYCKRPGDAKIVAGAREAPKDAEWGGKKNERWARSKRMGAAKRARVEAARKAV